MLQRILPAGKDFIKEIVTAENTLVDATCGNGHDTGFLAGLVPDGHVYSFDVQAEAIDSAREKYNGDNITFVHDGHENISQYVKAPVRAGIFNLGYLPGGDKSITTAYDTTIAAVTGLFELLSPGGRIVIVVYHGHDSGKVERDALLETLSAWPQDKAQVLRYQYINQKNNAPFLLVIEKLK
ncbi:Ribosomal RNA small subunit methyltransferase H [Jeotgalicoccus saudimassiliensis]|uniref:Ribosomal RNA small subunit methyltransferase H n=2 Tax=Jeotgalicoccus saudimassiliensis TaxID=1461582 RepID=A0A078M0L4_9STAP|nr:Ribosomal RNA small subunit methyltransferase H [Jeotgalicoccus saudimassiliensis]